MALRLEKYQALGNDFLVLVDLDDRHPVAAASARAWCDRRRGVGADGLIRVKPGHDGADVAMELYNADGSRAETSGNGLRCLALAVVDAGVVQGPEVRVGTDAGVRRVVMNGRAPSVDMGPATVEDDVVEGVARAAKVTIGNPHRVWEVGDVDDPEVARRAYLDSRSATPANVEVLTLGPGPDELTMRVWERGVGQTDSCGSGACAAAAAAHRWALVGHRVTVHQPGGDLVVELGPDTVVLTGPAEHVATVELPCR